MRKTLLFILLLSSFSLTAQMQMRLRGSHNPVLTPQQVDSLFYWFDAANLSSLQDSVGGAIATDEGVATWYDMSGRGYHVTSAGGNTKRPVYKATGGPTSKPCIQFDGSDDYLASSAHFWGSDDLTVFAVVKFTNATRDASEEIVCRMTATTTRQWDILGIGASGSYAGLFRQFNDGASANEWRLTTGNNYKHTNWKVHAWTHDGSTTTTLYTDASNQSITQTNTGTGNGTIYNYSGKLSIGAAFPDGTLAALLQGSISEIIVYSKALTADERVGIEEYLQAKWGL